jgi:hypothetical protein
MATSTKRVDNGRQVSLNKPVKKRKTEMIA